MPSTHVRKADRRSKRSRETQDGQPCVLNNFFRDRSILEMRERQPEHHATPALDELAEDALVSSCSAFKSASSSRSLAPCDDGFDEPTLTSTDPSVKGG